MGILTRASRLLEKREEAPRLLSLMYHAIDEADGEPESEDYTVSSSRFAEHLRALRNANARSYPLDRILAGSPLAPQEKPSVLLTFDDGFESVLTRAAKPMADAGFAGVLFVTTDRIGDPGYLSETQVKALLNAGIAVGTHGTSHRYLTDLSPRDLRDELHASKARLESLVGYPIFWLSAPGGRVNKAVLSEAQKAGYRAVFGSNPGWISPSARRNRPLPRISVTESTAPHQIQRFAEGDLLAMLRERARYEALRVPKKVLGNTGYDALRKVVLHVRRDRS